MSGLSFRFTLGMPAQRATQRQGQTACYPRGGSGVSRVRPPHAGNGPSRFRGLPPEEGFRKDYSMSHRWALLLFLMLMAVLAPELFAQAAPTPDGQESTRPSRDAQRRGGQMRGEGLFGRIQSISGNEITVERPDGQTDKVRVTPQTSYSIDRNAAKLGDFKVGQGVAIRGAKGEDNVWTAESVAGRSGNSAFLQGQLGKDYVVGEVKSIDGASITVVRTDGVTQTLEADENTSLRKRREAVTLADIHAGDTIMARGELKDGAFVPKIISVITSEDVQRMRQWMGGKPSSAPAPQEKNPAAETKPPQDRR